MNLGLSACGVGVFLLYKNQKSSFARAPKPWQPRSEPFFINPVYGNKLKTNSQSFWDSDWDGKEEYFQKQKSSGNTKMKGSRTLMFVSSSNKPLSNCKNLENQSALSAVEKFCSRLKLLNSGSFEKIAFSVEDNKNCMDTANNIYNNLSSKSKITLEKNIFLSQCVPYLCSPLSADDLEEFNNLQDKDFSINKLHIDKAGLDAAFYDIFYRPKSDQRTLEMYVCHPIVCSLMFCKALQLEPRRYFSFKQNQELSFFVLKINEEGHVTCHSFSDLTFDRYQNED